jgi:hypothetical protein
MNFLSPNISTNGTTAFAGGYAADLLALERETAGLLNEILGGRE